jgi:sugar transferase (PEP-CTERM/EpsH1 system associated)
MRIFVLLSRIPYPLEKGDKLRAYNQVKELSKNNEIILCALNPVRNVDKKEAFSSLQPYCRSVNFIDIPFPGRMWNMFLSLLNGLPIQTGYFYNSRASKKIRNLVKEYKPDHIYCQLLRTAEYVKDFPIPKTIDYQDVFSYGVKRRIARSSSLLKPLLKLEYKRLVDYEIRIFDVFDNKTIISIPDRDLIQHPDRKSIAVIPNGVDHEYFFPQTAEKKYELVFTGNMAYPPNVDAAGFLVKEIMPIVWKQIPEARVLVAGASPDRKVLSLKSEKVSVSGWMDDIRDSYASAMVFIAPMRIGTGLQNKLLEAMSMKVPSITTPLANDALQAKDGIEILIGDGAENLAKQIIRLLTEKSLYEKIKENGYKFVKSSYSWEEATEKLNQIIQKTGKTTE